MTIDQPSSTGDARKGMIETFINRILFGLIAFAVLAAVVNGVIGYRGEQDRALETARDQKVGAEVNELIALQKQIEIDVVQVQQFMTDISATRGLNGLNDGWSEAEKNASAFKRDVARAKELATELGAPDLATAFDATASRFPDYYDTGLRMSHAYVAAGPAGGNAMMPQFDAAAEKITQSIEQTRTALKTTLDRVDTENRAVEAKLVNGQRNALALTCIAALITAVGSFGAMRFLNRRLMRPLSRLVAYMGEIADGDYTRESPVPVSQDELGDMARAVAVFRANALERRQMRLQQEEMDRAQAGMQAEQAKVLAQAAEDQQHVVAALAQRLQAMADGQLDLNIDGLFPEQFKRLRMDFNQAVKELSTALLEIRSASDAVAVAARDIAHGSTELSRRAEHQAATLEQTAAAHDEITATVAKTLAVARETSTMVSATKADAEKSRQIVGETVSAIHSIEKSSREITQIIGVIDEIAFQTNLLALNAGVEAARAGDAGRGFAVVAMEVRALAQRSAEAAKQIKALISESATAVDRGVALVGATGTTLNAIVDQVSAVADRVQEIATSAAEQTRGLEEVNVAISNLDQVTQHNAAAADASNQAAATLSHEAERLVRLVSRFRVSGQTPQGRAA